jgi:hypothetical protein
VEPGLRTVPEGQCGHIEVIAEALEAEILNLLHCSTLLHFFNALQVDLAIDIHKGK